MERKEKEKSNCAAVLAFILIVFLLFSSLPYFDGHFAGAQAGAAIDLITDQTPFNGMGANQSSDAYEPQDLVNLSALATYNGGPERNLPVAFEVNGPSNAFENVSIVGSATTDDSGVGTFSFRVPWPNVNAEEIIFGNWSAIATIDIAGQVVVDTLTFQVGWIIRITDLSTLDFHSKTQTVFVRQDLVVFNMTVENIARTSKSAAIKVDVQDSGKNPIIHVEMENMIFQPGKSNVQTSSQIPISADVGLANVSAAPFTAPPETGGRLYSPAIFTTFTIGEKDITITGLTVSSTSVYAGDTVGINVGLLNKGINAESFNVSVFYDEALIGTQQVNGLVPFANETVSFVWRTDSINPGFYQISASASLPGDVNPLDNTFVDGAVEIRSGKPAHDIAVLNVVPDTRIAGIGQTVSIVVTVKNKGSTPETFYVTVYYDNAAVNKELVTNLQSSVESELSFEWNTTGVSPSTYTISAVAGPVEGETQTADNTFVDGTVTILSASPQLPSEWLFFFAIVLIAGIAGVILLFFIFAMDRIHRRRPRPAYTVIAHPHI